MERRSKTADPVQSAARRPGLALDRQELLAVFAGGFLGVLARAGLTQAWPVGSGAWPWATFSVNLAGAALIGYLITRLQERLPPSQYRRALLGTGFCGALTTFSTLAAELVQMLEDGHAWLAGAYGSASLAGGLAAVFLSTKLVRRAHMRPAGARPWRGYAPDRRGAPGGARP